MEIILKAVSKKIGYTQVLDNINDKQGVFYL